MAAEGGARPRTFWIAGDDTFHTVRKPSQSIRNAGGSRRPHRLPRRRLLALPHAGPFPGRPGRAARHSRRVTSQETGVCAQRTGRSLKRSPKGSGVREPLRAVRTDVAGPALWGHHPAAACPVTRPADRPAACPADHPTDGPHLAVALPVGSHAADVGGVGDHVGAVDVVDGLVPGQSGQIPVVQHLVPQLRLCGRRAERTWWAGARRAGAPAAVGGGRGGARPHFPRGRDGARGPTPGSGGLTVTRAWVPTPGHHGPGQAASRSYAVSVRSGGAAPGQPAPVPPDRDTQAVP